MTNFSHRNLPHWVHFGGEFFITSCLKNAIPARKIADLQAQALQAMADLKKHPSHYDKTEKQKIFKRYFRDYDRLLDAAKTGHHYLKEPVVAQIVLDKIKEYDSLHYEVRAACIMSNHFHVLVDTGIQLARLPKGIAPTKQNQVGIVNLCN